MKLNLLFGRLLRRSSAPSQAFGILTVRKPKGYPPDKRISSPAGKGLPPKEFERQLRLYRASMRRHFAAIASFNRKRAVESGIAKYVWVVSAEPCDIAERNNGKTFSYLEPPPEGHVCEGLCNAPDWCRCYARPIVKGF